VPAEIADVTEPAALHMAASFERLPVRLQDGVVIHTTVARTSAARCLDASSPVTPLVLLHGFDSSALEFRRLFPLLEAASVPAFAVELIGSGFTGLQEAKSATPTTRREHLRSFLEQHVGSRPVDLLGASLGGTAALDFALNYAHLVNSLVLVDAQGFVEGTPQLPGPLADVGVSVLRAVWLRSLANALAYADKLRFATEDAIRVGRLHTHLPDWSRSTRTFMDSGGYTVRARIPQVRALTMVVWGADDEIIEPAVALQFAEELPNCHSVVYLPACGHVPHLERPQALLDAVLRFRSS
jgi:pimeloyl-ACP methyl ester carboxylesterase